MGVIAACGIWLNKLSGSDNIVIGGVVDGRHSQEFSMSAGMFANTLPIKINIAKEMTVTDLLKNVKKSVLEMKENSDYPLDELMEKLNIERDASRNPFFDFMISFEHSDRDSFKGSDITVKQITFEQKHSMFDISFDITEFNKNLAITVEYSTKLFKPETIRRFFKYFEHTLNSMSDSPAQNIDSLEWFDFSEINSLLLRQNSGGSYKPEKNIISVFEKQTELYPDRPAVVFGDIELTYAELNHKANIFADFLISKGVEYEDIIAIDMKNSDKIPIAILGILKAGCAYLPVAADYPEDRKKFMFADSKTKFIVSNFSGKFNSIDILNLTGILNSKNSAHYEKKINPNNLAYIIYTSGSTGEPKGVMIEHHSVVNCIENLRRNIFDNKSGLQMIMLSPFIFDASVDQIFGALLNGNTLHILPEEKILDIPGLFSYIQKNQIDIIDTPPSLISLLFEYANEINEDWHADYFNIGAEILKKQVAELLYKNKNNKNKIITNMYGPTEACVDAAYFRITNSDGIKNLVSIPIGKPILNCSIYILDKNLRQMPVGVPGEIFIGGAGLARGYLNSPEKTVEKFINSPFESGKKLYSTGDSGILLSDGNIDIIGRIDNQIKLKGFRIELHEIECVLKKHPYIADTSVIADKINETLEIIAYFTLRNEIKNSIESVIEELRNFVAIKLPNYMIPAYFVFLKDMPMTRSGKIDKKKLPSPDFSSCSADTIDDIAISEVEKIILSIWKDVLKNDSIGVSKRFFSIGGDSITTKKRIYR